MHNEISVEIAHGYGIVMDMSYGLLKFQGYFKNGLPHGEGLLYANIEYSSSGYYGN